MDAEPDHAYTPADIARSISRVVASTPTDWDHSLYIHRLANQFKSHGFSVKMWVKVPWRGTPDGLQGSITMVLEGYAAIEVNAYTPHPRSYIKLMQAPKGCRCLAIVLRLGSIPQEEWDDKYVPKQNHIDTPPTDITLQPRRTMLAIQSNIAVISAPLP